MYFLDGSIGADVSSLGIDNHWNVTNMYNIRGCGGSLQPLLSVSSRNSSHHSITLVTVVYVHMNVHILFLVLY